MNEEGTPKTLSTITVEDSSVVSNRLRGLFHEMEFVRYEGNATNIDDSLVLIQEFQPKVAIVDIQLKDDAPQRNGIDLLVLIRKQYPEMNVIVFTNITSSQYRDKCLSLGADYFLDKSNDFDRIPEILKTIHSQNMMYS